MVKYIFTHEYVVDVGTLILGEFEGKLCLCDWKFRKQRISIDKRLSGFFDAQFLNRETELIQETKHQLDKYFRSEIRTFKIPLVFAGTDFQQKVWTELLKIPYGACISYKDLSDSIGNSAGVRAVAAANGANSISIIVPCHRVIGATGNLVGYAGGLNVKQKLLILEGSMNSSQLNLFSE